MICPAPMMATSTVSAEECDFDFIFSASSSRWLLSELLVATQSDCISLHFYGRSSHTLCPFLESCSVNQTQKGALETDQGLAGSRSLSVGTLELPTDVHNYFQKHLAL